MVIVVVVTVMVVVVAIAPVSAATRASGRIATHDMTMICLAAASSSIVAVLFCLVTHCLVVCTR